MMESSEIDIAYSYLRFSGKRQERGDSIRRQRNLARSWARRMKIPLDETLKIDKGISAFKGRNADIGSLGAFLKLVDEGIVKPGSYLVVENLDRISRDEVQDALRLILNILGAGVRVVQLSPRELVYTAKSDSNDLMWMIGELSRANGESALKSKRLLSRRRRERKAMRTKGRKNRQRLPGWVKRVKGALVEIPERADIVRRIFALCLSGVSLGGIARVFNEESVPTFSGSGQWSQGYVRQIVTDGRAHGRHQPRGPGREPDGEPLEDYYPVVVSRETADRAQSALAGRVKAGRAPGEKFVNVFRKLCRDAGTGHLLALSTVAHQGFHYRYLLVTRNTPFEGRRPMHRLDVLEQGIFSALQELNVADVIGTGQRDVRQALDLADADLRQSLESQRDLIERLKRKTSPTLLAAADEIDEQIADAKHRIAVARMALATPIAHSWQHAQTLMALARQGDAETRHRLYGALTAIVDGIWLTYVDVGTTRLTLAQIRFAGGAVRDYLIALRRWTVKEGSATQGADWGVWSLAHAAGEAPRDLRDARQSEEVRKHLRAMDVSSLELRPYSR